jgi:hypothetical protein
MAGEIPPQGRVTAFIHAALTNSGRYFGAKEHA